MDWLKWYVELQTKNEAGWFGLLKRKTTGWWCRKRHHTPLKQWRKKVPAEVK